MWGCVALPPSVKHLTAELAVAVYHPKLPNPAAHDIAMHDTLLSPALSINDHLPQALQLTRLTAM